jgi:hypothetical protein
MKRRTPIHDHDAFVSWRQSMGHKSATDTGSYDNHISFDRFRERSGLDPCAA